ncbi:hypothetical protein QBC34DRAFT_165935 [Podospora aff. communis PSN243]|uniref:Uncharacterized protein n=1 Tax=Podospora aff. communis PSN243 TaxID=3040156 RepID=A0AAV9GAL8_9PEZI|nr:hypothetical protein QBC34DRAFT_165935 [Podospora aff. communis PSN243]
MDLQVPQALVAPALRFIDDLASSGPRYPRYRKTTRLWNSAKVDLGLMCAAANLPGTVLQAVPSSGSAVSCLESEFEKFIVGLKKRERRSWEPFNKGDGVDVEALRQHLISIQTTHVRDVDSRPPLTRMSHSTVRELNRHAGAFDQLMQSQPDLVAAGWGVLRFMMNVVTEYQQAPGAASAALQCVCASLDSLGPDDDGVSSSRSESLAGAQRLVISQALILMRSAINTLERKRLKRVMCALIRQTTAELLAMKQTLEASTLSLNVLVTAHQTNAANRGKPSSAAPSLGVLHVLRSAGYGSFHAGTGHGLTPHGAQSLPSFID